MSVDGELVQLTDDAADDIDPAWSPDGSRDRVFEQSRRHASHLRDER